MPSRPPYVAALVLLLMTPLLCAEKKAHAISYGKTLAVKLFLGPDEAQTLPLKVRALAVDGKVKEFVTGDAHEVTDRLFVVRRAYRLNNNLPEEEGKGASWVWERGGWLMVDRLTGHVTAAGAGGVRSVLLPGQLVPRLCGLLRSERRRPKAERGGDAAGTKKNTAEKRAWNGKPGGYAGFPVRRSAVGEEADAHHFFAETRPKTDVYRLWPRLGRGSRLRGGVARAQTGRFTKGKRGPQWPALEESCGLAGRSYVSNPTPEPAEVPDPVAQTQDRDRIGEPNRAAAEAAAWAADWACRLCRTPH